MQQRNSVVCDRLETKKPSDKSKKKGGEPEVVLYRRKIKMADTRPTNMQPIENRDLEHATHLRIFRNGDINFGGRSITWNKKRIRTFDSFLDELTNTVKLRNGAVFRVYTPHHGHRVTNFEKLQEGGLYVAAGQEPFKPLGYTEIDPNPRRRNNKRNTDYYVEPVTHSKLRRSGKIKYIKSEGKIIKVWPNGDSVNPPRVILLTSWMQKDMDVIYDAIAERVSALLAGSVTRLYSLDGTRVKYTDQIHHGGQYVACAHQDKLRHVDYKDHGAKSIMTTPRLDSKFLPPLSRSTNKSTKSSKFSTPDHSNPTSSYASEKSSKSGYSTKYKSRQATKKEDDGVFHAKPVAHKRGSQDKVKKVDYDKDEGGVFKAKGKNRSTSGAREIEDTADTQTELPIDQREAETIEEEGAVRVPSGLELTKPASIQSSQEEVRSLKTPDEREYDLDYRASKKSANEKESDKLVNQKPTNEKESDKSVDQKSTNEKESDKSVDQKPTNEKELGIRPSLRSANSTLSPKKSVTFSPQLSSSDKPGKKPSKTKQKFRGLCRRRDTDSDSEEDNVDVDQSENAVASRCFVQKRVLSTKVHRLNRLNSARKRKASALSNASSLKSTTNNDFDDWEDLEPCCSSDRTSRPKTAKMSARNKEIETKFQRTLKLNAKIQPQDNNAAPLKKHRVQKNTSVAVPDMKMGNSTSKHGQIQSILVQPEDKPLSGNNVKKQKLTHNRPFLVRKVHCGTEKKVPILSKKASQFGAIFSKPDLKQPKKNLPVVKAKPTQSRAQNYVLKQKFSAKDSKTTTKQEKPQQTDLQKSSKESSNLAQRTTQSRAQNYFVGKTHVLKPKSSSKNSKTTTKQEKPQQTYLQRNSKEFSTFAQKTAQSRAQNFFVGKTHVLNQKSSAKDSKTTTKPGKLQQSDFQKNSKEFSTLTQKTTQSRATNFFVGKAHALKQKYSAKDSKTTTKPGKLQQSDLQRNSKEFSTLAQKTTQSKATNFFVFKQKPFAKDSKTITKQEKPQQTNLQKNSKGSSTIAQRTGRPSWKGCSETNSLKNKAKSSEIPLPGKSIGETKSRLHGPKFEDAHAGSKTGKKKASELKNKGSTEPGSGSDKGTNGASAESDSVSKISASSGYSGYSVLSCSEIVSDTSISDGFVWLEMGSVELIDYELEVRAKMRAKLAKEPIVDEFKSDASNSGPLLSRLKAVFFGGKKKTEHVEESNEKSEEIENEEDDGRNKSNNNSRTPRNNLPSQRQQKANSKSRNSNHSNKGQTTPKDDGKNTEEEDAAIKLQSQFRGYQVRKQLTEEGILSQQNGYVSRSPTPPTQSKNKPTRTNNNIKNQPKPVTKATRHTPKSTQQSQEKKPTEKTPPKNGLKKTSKTPDNKKGAKPKKENNDREVKAATTIQAGFRGYKTRQNLKQRQDSPIGSMSEELAATKIQAGFRGKKARSDMKKAKSELEDKIDKKYSEEEEKAATKIQAGFRGYKTRREVLEKEAEDFYTEEEHQAAAKIQSGFRGFRTRKELALQRKSEYSENGKDSLEKYNDEHHKAAVKIQSGMRGVFARKEMARRQAQKLYSTTEEQALSNYESI